MNEQDIFLAALEIADPTQQAEYLSRTCASNPALLRQVEALLAAHERSGEFLDVPALQQIAGRAPSPSERPVLPGAQTGAEPTGVNEEIDLSLLQPSSKPGSLGRLGHYEIQEVIGRGGCGIVLKAFDDRLERVVAIKVIAPELAATSPARKRFLREARAAAAIRDENVVSIHGVEEQPIPFLVMDYIPSQTLQQKLDHTGPLEAQEVVQIGQQIASGLAAAHARGLIHRDIKPANILLEQGNDRVKITDFGLARTADDASISQSGMIAGTPLYMSPEQALSQPIDQRSDLFSLGSVLYVMCSGRPPFRAETTLAVLMRVAEEKPRPIQEIIPEVPAWLVAIIARLHAKKPEDRFASAQEVAELLAHCHKELQQHGRVDALPNNLPMTPRPATAAESPVTDERPAIVEKPLLAPEARRPRSRRWATAAAVILVLLAGLGLTEATGVTNVRGTVIRLFSPDGTLVVEVDDPGVSVTIDGEEMIITGTGAREIRLKPGQYTVLASKDGKLVRQELVTVARNGRQVVRVSKEAVAARVIGETPTIEKSLASRFKNSIGMEFVLVPKGKFLMGAWNQDPQNAKEVQIPYDFYLGMYEVTQGEWQAVTGTNPSWFSRTGEGKDRVKDIPDQELKRFPVESVSWADAQLFVEQLNAREKEPGWVYRLPKDAEWEYACRGGPRDNKFEYLSDFYFEKPTNVLLPEQANFAPEQGKGLQRTCKVGSYKPNPLGLYDMHGNVAEWVAPEERPPQGGSIRHPRGGSWWGPGWQCALTHNGQLPLGYRRQAIHGLRVARVPVGIEQTSKALAPVKPPE